MSGVEGVLVGDASRLESEVDRHEMRKLEKWGGWGYSVSKEVFYLSFLVHGRLDLEQADVNRKRGNNAVQRV